MKHLTGILRNGVFYEAPAWEPAPEEEQEQDVEHKNSLTQLLAGFSQRIEEQRRAPDESIALGAAVEFLSHLRTGGRRVTLVDGDRVRVQGAPLTAEQVERVKALKPALLRILAAEAPESPGA